MCTAHCNTILLAFNRIELPASNTKVLVLFTTTGLTMADGSRNGRFAHRLSPESSGCSGSTTFPAPSSQACGIFSSGSAFPLQLVLEYNPPH